MSSENIGIEEARKRLGDLVTAVQQGADIVLTRNGKPAARIVPYLQEPAMHRRFSTRQDVIEQAIKPALDDGNYDLEAICDETYTWAIDTDAHGNEVLNTGGFEQTVTDEEFWEIVARHDLSD
jgi:prevent-host-death family protein